ncbi:MAG TPA: serine hydroxymethyltransferase, partial [Clostridiales bacterium]|nr:serine hydroxymethyltransferase [Clostridiales bacterium]
RLGTPAVTSRGFTETEMDVIADYIYKTITNFDATEETIRKGALELCASHPIY